MLSDGEVSALVLSDGVVFRVVVGLVVGQMKLSSASVPVGMYCLKPGGSLAI